MEGANEATVAVIVFETFWSKTVRRTQKQKTTDKSSVCLSASEFAELPSTPIFASRAEILSQIQLYRRLYRSSYSLINPFEFFASFAVRFINSGTSKKSAPLKDTNFFKSLKLPIDAEGAAN